METSRLETPVNTGVSKEYGRSRHIIIHNVNFDTSYVTWHLNDP